MRLLLVEGHERIWNVLSRWLECRGCNVIAATGRRAGVDRTRADAPAMILLDMNLPILDRWSAVRIVKSKPATAGTPIPALTAHAMSGDRGKAMAAGCADHHPKPTGLLRLMAGTEALAPGAGADA